ncbi:MAG: NAD(P)-dependent oxidoreductase [archaeon]|jgi:nucleoside-diphosphate-sugar epimerase
MRTRKVLITGADGFLGKEVILQLKKNKIPFVACSHKNKRGFKQIDITKKILLKGNFKAVIHLAAKNYATIPEQYYMTNTDGTKNILDFCVQNQIKQIIYSSSCSVYGKILNGTITELSKPTEKSDYGKSKALAETEIEKYGQTKGIQYTIFRFPIILGKTQKENRLTKVVQEYVTTQKPIFEKNSSFALTYVKDCAKLIVQSLDKQTSGTYNAVAYVTSIKEIFNILNEITGKAKPAEFKENSKSSLVISCVKAKKQLNFSPITLKEAIKKTFSKSNLCKSTTQVKPN